MWKKTWDPLRLPPAPNGIFPMALNMECSLLNHFFRVTSKGHSASFRKWVIFLQDQHLPFTVVQLIILINQGRHWYSVLMPPAPLMPKDMTCSLPTVTLTP